MIEILLYIVFTIVMYNLSKQLEKIYDDIDAGTLDKTGKFYKFIKDIKTANPKPS